MWYRGIRKWSLIAQLWRWESNPQPFDNRAGALPLRHAEGHSQILNLDIYFISFRAKVYIIWYLDYNINKIIDTSGIIHAVILISTQNIFIDEGGNRTHDPSINSNALYHYATKEHICYFRFYTNISFHLD